MIPARAENSQYDTYEVLLLERDSLRKEAGQIWTLYVKTFGQLMSDLFKEKIACIRQKKLITYYQAAINRGQMENYSESNIPWAASGNEIYRVIVEDGISSVGDYAFCSLGKLTEVSLPATITSIGNDSFASCRALTNISIPDRVTAIGDNAFHQCDSLKSITIPDSVTSIDWEAFPRPYWDSNDFVVFTQSAYVKNYCYLNYIAYFDRTAPSITKLVSYNGSDIRIYFEKKKEAVAENLVFGTECAAGYQIKYADNKNMANARSIMLKDRKAASKEITGLQNGKTYYVRIQTFRKVSGKTWWSSWSKAKQIKITK